MPLPAYILHDLIGCRSSYDLPQVGAAIEKASSIAEDLASAEFPLAVTIMKGKLAFDELAIVVESSDLQNRELLADSINAVSLTTIQLVDKLSSIMVFKSFNIVGKSKRLH